MIFNSLPEGIKFYEDYASACGFVSRESTNKKAADGSGVTIWKHVVCNRQGSFAAQKKKYVSPLTNKNKRKRTSKRCFCPARIFLRFQEGGRYKVTQFNEAHTHIMLADTEKQFVKSNRKLSSFHQDFIMNCINVNVGPTKTYRVYKQFVGSYADVGSTIVDFKNCKRDLNAFLHGHDAQMVIDNLFKKKENSSSYYFDYSVDDDHQLSRLFWCDAIGRKSFTHFGEAVTVDATYSKNRYKY